MISYHLSSSRFRGWRNSVHVFKNFRSTKLFHKNSTNCSHYQKPLLHQHTAKIHKHKMTKTSTTKLINPQHFKTDPTDIWIGINYRINILKTKLWKLTLTHTFHHLWSYDLWQNRNLYIIIFLPWRMRKLTSTKLGRHGQKWSTLGSDPHLHVDSRSLLFFHHCRIGYLWTSVSISHTIYHTYWNDWRHISGHIRQTSRYGFKSQITIGWHFGIGRGLRGVRPYRAQTILATIISATARRYWQQPKTISATRKSHIGHRPYRPQNIWWVYHA